MVHSNLSLDLGSTAEESHADQAEELCSLTRLRSVPLRSCSLTKPSPLRKLHTDEAEELTAEELFTNETVTAEELHTDEAEGLTTEELLTDETVPLWSCSLTPEESHTDEAEELTAEELLTEWPRLHRPLALRGVHFQHSLLRLFLTSTTSINEHMSLTPIGYGDIVSCASRSTSWYAVCK